METPNPYGPPMTGEVHVGAPPGAGRPGARRPRRGYVFAFAGVGLVIALAFAVAVGVFLLRDPEPVDVAGTVTLADDDPSATAFHWGIPGRPEHACQGFGGYSDITEGAAVTIRNASGKVVAVSQLGVGAAEGFGESVALAEGAPTRCTFLFSVSKVPADDFYSIEVSHRGGVTFSRKQVTAGEVALSIGG